MNYKILVFLIVSSFYQCGYQTNSGKAGEVDSSALKSSNEGIDSNNIKIDTGCIAGLKPNNDAQVVGCVSGFYKVMNANYVLKINVPLALSCQKVEIDSSSDIELLVFKSGKATIINTCSDEIISYEGGAPATPLYSIKAQSGLLSYVFTTEGSKHNEHFATIIIDWITFIDPKTKKVIEIKNEVYYKVMDWGMPG